MFNVQYIVFSKCNTLEFALSLGFNIQFAFSLIINELIGWLVGWVISVPLSDFEITDL